MMKTNKQYFANSNIIWFQIHIHKYSTVRSPAVPHPQHHPLAAAESVRVNKLYNADTEADTDTQVC